MIFTIFKKELKDTLRDRRTLMTMIVIPMFIFPVIMTAFVKISESFNKEAASKTFHFGVLANDTKTMESMIQIQKQIPNFEIIPYTSEEQLKKDVKSDSLQAGVAFPSETQTNNESLKTTKASVYFNATEVGMQERAELFLNALDKMEQQKRFVALKIEPKQIHPYDFDYTNIASGKETVGKLIGGFLPYMFIIFGFIGCMYPAIDLFTGEKERGTLETLLTTPVSRWQVLLGKMGVVVLSGFMAATFTLTGIFLTIEVFDVIKDPKLLEIIHQILTPGFIGLLFVLLLPLIVFFAGIMVPIAVYAKTFKEAQSIITPLNTVVILPAMIGFFPGIEYNLTTSLIPIVNVVLATKELIAGTIDFGLLTVSFFSMTALAGLSIVLSYKRFDNEKNLVI